jgi:hypothetical protein
MLEEAIRDWDGFRRALRKDDLLAFDGMMRKARSHSSASGFNPMADTAEAIFISILLEHEKEIEELKKTRRAKAVDRSELVELANRDERTMMADRDERTMMADRDERKRGRT